LDTGKFQSLVSLKRPKVILLNLDLPGVSGLEVLNWLGEWCDSQVIVVAGQASATEKRPMLESGAVHYIIEPLVLDKVISLVERALERYEQIKVHNLFLALRDDG
jgi:DNA-binding response OmpR family regulator